MHQVRAISLYSYLAVASAAGIDGRRLLADAGISRKCLGDTETRIPAPAAIRLLERSAELSGWDSFGIRMARNRSFASLGPLSLLIERLNTIGEVVTTLTALRKNLNDVLFVSTQYSGESVSVTFDIVAPYSQPQAADLTLGLGYLALVGASHGLWAPQVVHFTHASPKDRLPFERFFRTQLSFDDDFNGFSFNRTGLDIPLPLADPAIARDTQHLLGLMHAAVSERTRHAISRLLPIGEATISNAAGSNVAGSLKKADRVLQRQLEAEGQTFARLLNDLRRDLAQRYLISSGQNLTSIAAALGYSSPGSFTRWFVQEFRSSPSQWRKTRGAPLHDDLDVIFSLKDGEVWANWQDLRPAVNLGSHEAVIAMMSDYIKQTELASRLLGGPLALL